MLKIRIPRIESYNKQCDKIGLPSYHIYSSIYEPSPKAFISFNTPYLTPEALGLVVGDSMQIGYSLVKGPPEDGGESEEDEPTYLPGLNIAQTDTDVTPSGTNIQLQLIGDFEFFQNSSIRKAYINKYGNEIVEDILNSNDAVKGYERCLEKTDNATLLYRTLGDSDSEFIKKHIGGNCLIAGGQTLFYTSLDRKVHFTSINKIRSSTDKSHLVLRMPTTADEKANEMIESLLDNLVDKEDCLTLHTDKSKIVTGGFGSVRNLKNIVYFSEFGGKSVTSTGYAIKPASTEKSVYPISKIFMGMLKGTHVDSIINRPTSSAAYEAANFYPSPENLITIKAIIKDPEVVDRLILAGDVMTVVTSYPFSWYNGNYIVAEVEYGYDPGDKPGDEVDTGEEKKESEGNAINLTLIRPTLDPQWSEKLDDLKDSDEFAFPFAPPVSKSSLYSI